MILSKALFVQALKANSLAKKDYSSQPICFNKVFVDSCVSVMTFVLSPVRLSFLPISVMLSVSLPSFIIRSLSGAQTGFGSRSLISSGSSLPGVQFLSSLITSPCPEFKDLIYNLNRINLRSGQPSFQVRKIATLIEYKT